MNNRSSNIELLRLLCMFLIICIHFTGYSIIQCSEHYATQTGFVSLFPQLIHGVCWCAVNTFILISGYFSIRPKAKSFFSLYLVCAIYAGGLYLVYLYFTNTPLNRWVVYNTLMPFGLWKSSTNWWFIPNYLILYILSPLLNKLIDSITKRELQYFLILQAIVIFYFGWYRNEEWNGTGLNFINFIFLYFIGRYISLYVQLQVNGRWKFLLLWIIFGVSMGLIDWYVYFNKPSISWLWFVGQYNSPFCVASAICLFMLFVNLHIKQSKVINWLAVSALPIYLVHNCRYASDYLYPLVTNIYDSLPLFKAYVLIFLLAALLVIVIPLLDKIRLLVSNPILKLLCNLYYKIKPKLVTKFQKCHH